MNNLKEINIKTAKWHAELMEEVCSEQIKFSANNTLVYTGKVDPIFKEDSDIRVCYIDNATTTDAIYKYCPRNKTGGKKICILNFASYKVPGGGFLKGSMAQEESICHDSTLYNVLVRQKDYYAYNNKHLNYALYTNRALYSPQIYFPAFDIYCDVITCAAPNLTACKRFNPDIAKKENSRLLKERIKFILDIAAENKVDTLILGAFGCGVFGQNIEEVINIFWDYLISGYRCFSEIIFAIPEDEQTHKYSKILAMIDEKIHTNQERV